LREGIGPLIVSQHIKKPRWWSDTTVNWRLDGKRIKSLSELISCVIINQIRYLHGSN
jgi:hypothetical protein